MKPGFRHAWAVRHWKSDRLLQAWFCFNRFLSDSYLLKTEILGAKLRVVKPFVYEQSATVMSRLRRIEVGPKEPLEFSRLDVCDWCLDGVAKIKSSDILFAMVPLDRKGPMPKMVPKVLASVPKEPPEEVATTDAVPDGAPTDGACAHHRGVLRR